MGEIVLKNFKAVGQSTDINRLCLSDGLIVSDVSPLAKEIDLQQDFLSIGLFDTHINGGYGQYFTECVSPEAIADIEKSSLDSGTVYTLPCLITSSPDNILKGIRVMKDYMAQNPQSGVLGLHLEGPFLNPVKRGAHLAKYVQKPDPGFVGEIISEGKDVIKIMTVAPEVFDAETWQLLLSSGITISAGHSNASYAQAREAFANGVGLCTHLYNAMSAFGHREPGLIGAVLNTPHVYAPIILDGYHCHFDAAKLAYQMKGDKLFLISDALFLGQRKKEFQWEEFDARLSENVYVNSEGNLAGGAVSLADCVYNAVHQLGIAPEMAIEMASTRPFLAIKKQAPSFEIGQPAKFTVFSRDLKTCRALIG